MKHQLLLLLVFVFLFISCQEDPFNEAIDPIDEDMEHATQLAKEYMSSQRGKYDSEVSVIVLKQQNDNLLYVSNTDDAYGYRDLDEETITATVHPGDYIFWYGGQGVSDLDGIEFDPASQNQLGKDPSEIYQDALWVISIPENIYEEYGLEEGDNENFILLKYDIIYLPNGNYGAPIRLDPKLKVTQ